MPHASGEVSPAPTVTANANTPKHVNIQNTALKKIAEGNQTRCFLRRPGNIHSQVLSEIIHYTFLSVPLTACTSPVYLDRTDALVLYPAWENCIQQRGTPRSVGLFS